MAYQGLGRDGGRSGWSWMPVGGSPNRSARFPLAGWFDALVTPPGTQEGEAAAESIIGSSTALTQAAAEQAARQRNQPSLLQRIFGGSTPEPPTPEPSSGLGVQTAIMFLGAGAIGFLIGRKKFAK